MVIMHLSLGIVSDRVCSGGWRAAHPGRERAAQKAYQEEADKEGGRSPQKTARADSWWVSMLFFFATLGRRLRRSSYCSVQPAK